MQEVSLLHDITKVDPDQGFKGRIFKKGHIVKQEDIQTLKKVGKDHIYVFEIGDDKIHENDAAKILSNAVSGENTYTSKEPKEGKITIFSNTFGVCKIDVEKLFKFNSVGEPSMPTIYNNSIVKKGDKVAAVRIISLLSPKKDVEDAVKIAGEGIIKIVPFTRKKAGLKDTDKR